MKARVLFYYPGSNPYSSLPILCLEISGARREVAGLMRAREALREITGDSREDNKFYDSVWTQPTDCCNQEEFWIRNWFSALLSWSGLIQIDQCDHSTPDKNKPSEALKCRILLNCFRDDFRKFIGLTKWSLDCWSFLAGNIERHQDASLLRKAFLALHRPSIKESFVAMVKYLAKSGLYVGVSYVNGNYWLHAGIGCYHRQFSQKMTGATSASGLQDSKDKLLAKKLLLDAGLPVATGGVAPSLATAQELAQKLGYPLVLKPVALDQGIGVVTGIKNAKELQQAWSSVSEHSSRIMLEKHIPGRDFRFLLVNGSLVASLERIPGGVVGDGSSTIRALVDAEKQKRIHPICVEGGAQLRLRSLNFDDEARAMLAAQRLDENHILPAGQYVRLRYTANFSVGGTVRECGAEIHPFNIFLLKKVASTFRLDIVGVDIIAPSMDVPLNASGAVICEVNGMPGVVPHMLAEPGRALMAEVANLLLHPRRQVPVVAIHGSGAAGFILKLEQEVLPRQPQLITASRAGLRQAGELLRSIDGSQLSVQMGSLRDTSSPAFVFEISTQELVAHGLACPKLDLLILAQSEQDPLPEMMKNWLRNCAITVIELPNLDDPEADDQVSSAFTTAAQILSQPAD